MRTKQRMTICFGIVFAVLIGAIGIAVGAEAPPEEWTRTFGGYAAYSVDQTTDGGYIVACSVPGTSDYDDDVQLIKTDFEGTEKWTRTFDGNDLDGVWSVQQTEDGGYIFAGLTETAGDLDAWLVKVDSSGDEIWSKTFGGTGMDEAYSVQETNAGYIFAGYTYLETNKNAWLVEVDSSGNMLWSQTYGGNGEDMARSVLQVAADGFVFGGYTDVAGDQNAWLVKVDSSGNKIWDRTFGGTGSDMVTSVQQTADGGYVLTGSTQVPAENVNDDVWLVKTGSEGFAEWTKTFGSDDFDLGLSVQQTADDGYIIAGIVGFGSSKDDAWLIKTDSAGYEEWNKTFGLDDRHDWALSVQQTGDGGYIIAGDIYSGACLIKIAGTPAEEIEYLIKYVSDLDKDDAYIAALVGKLNNALHHLAMGHEDMAIQRLEDIIDFIDNQLLPQGRLDDEDASYLKEGITDIIALIRISEG
ncbi:MAG: hypothetical protein A4E24_01768 [Methanomethylovorans sp. PtaU1.Bin093]|uniref:FIMAH domain-containing protein n=1 Tax=Methanomethylovorans sp. PtaU1.Bin093 TaxID=1811679 RepID=UPI0009CC53F5|nr:hypothetical protein [Methanomethylovorans sp. PtaU1.Bin093]OPY18842.1 MAG: hypothetical protein A4E24_01768 [Methanomethylovorans sp. PtaU1.Bin093]